MENNVLPTDFFEQRKIAKNKLDRLQDDLRNRISFIVSKICQTYIGIGCIDYNTGENTETEPQYVVWNFVMSERYRQSRFLDDFKNGTAYRFPFFWLYSDFEDDFNQRIEKCKEKWEADRIEKEKQQIEKENRIRRREAVKAKLTKEELELLYVYD